MSWRGRQLERSCCFAFSTQHRETPTYLYWRILWTKTSFPFSASHSSAQSELLALRSTRTCRDHRITTARRTACLPQDLQNPALILQCSTDMQLTLQLLPRYVFRLHPRLALSLQFEVASSSTPATVQFQHEIIALPVNELLTLKNVTKI